MASRRATGPASDAAALPRRSFLIGSVALLAWPLAARAEEGEAAAWSLPEATASALGQASFVYVSPLSASGAESTCHGEVWYGYLEGAVFLVTSKESWKARSLAKGRDRARIWVGDYGTWKRGPLRNWDFRTGPSFVARASRHDGGDLFEQLMLQYGERYPDEIGKWEPRFREGLISGERVLLRYQPMGA